MTDGEVKPLCFLSAFCSVFSAMEKKPCPAGSSWDPLLRRCFSQNALGPTVAPPPLPKPVLSSRAPGISWLVFSPSVWICVGLLLSGSVLVLLLWFIIYRRHHRTSQNTGEKDATPHTQTAVEQEEEVPWQHLGNLTQEMPISEQHCGRTLCTGRDLYNGWVEHGLPLPATELGDSALVTTKTGHPVEV
ncbi:tumor necrosis factor receptor superfamily member 13C-like [Danio aesculapii]|uniref:tumor necrosis factor receptor superfamily member 13C-like n=1 Tax=Danio aesculapii TaxID=1142201 RepID=UPI0024C03781|nr:tumor necrosis factor receptor superfamily member 13C-like [Danio aesculapii]